MGRFVRNILRVSGLLFDDFYAWLMKLCFLSRLARLLLATLVLVLRLFSHERTAQLDALSQIRPANQGAACSTPFAAV